jgi:hypothetical protein
MAVDQNISVPQLFDTPHPQVSWNKKNNIPGFTDSLAMNIDSKEEIVHPQKSSSRLLRTWLNHFAPPKETWTVCIPSSGCRNAKFVIFRWLLEPPVLPTSHTRYQVTTIAHAN